jgi:hypothetical protein
MIHRKIENKDIYELILYLAESIDALDHEKELDCKKGVQDYVNSLSPEKEEEITYGGSGSYRPSGLTGGAGGYTYSPKEETFLLKNALEFQIIKLVRRSHLPSECKHQGNCLEESEMIHELSAMLKSLLSQAVSEERARVREEIARYFEVKQQNLYLRDSLLEFLDNPTQHE